MPFLLNDSVVLWLVQAGVCEQQQRHHRRQQQLLYDLSLTPLRQKIQTACTLEANFSASSVPYSYQAYSYTGQPGSGRSPAATADQTAPDSSPAAAA